MTIGYYWLATEEVINSSWQFKVGQKPPLPLNSNRNAAMLSCFLAVFCNQGHAKPCRPFHHLPLDKKNKNETMFLIFLD